MRILNRKEAKELIAIIEERWKCKLDWLDKCYMVLTEKNNIHLINREIERIELNTFRINTLGLYIGEIKNKTIRLSIEGSQLVPATTNTIELDREQAKQWLKGEDLKITGNTGFVIIKHNKDTLGCGNLKEGTLLNFVPKARRLNFH